MTHGPALQTETPKVVLINRGIRRVELSRQIIEASLATGLLDFPFLRGGHFDFLTLLARCELKSVLQRPIKNGRVALPDAVKIFPSAPPEIYMKKLVLLSALETASAGLSIIIRSNLEIRGARSREPAQLFL